ncbi:MAG: hypothetical protein IJU57_02590 [Clostridia bacterium]|nr:hypothetical protein [Clostridia bacterium]
MRILLASPDRDFLEAYEKLLCDEFGYVKTAFDGTAVLSLLKEQDFDVCVIDSKLPRVNYRTIVSRLDAKKIPSVILVYKGMSPALLCLKDPVTEYMPLPFPPGELKSVITRADGSYGETVSYDTGTGNISYKNNRIGNSPVTLSEKQLLKFAAENSGDGGDGTDIQYGMSCTESLNRKFAEEGCQAKIKYINGKGFMLVDSR